MSDETTRIHYDLRNNWDGDPNPVPCVIELCNGVIWIRPEGYGDCGSQDGHGFPIKIEYYDKSVSVLVWGDINQEDPTVKVKLDDARESCRLA